MPLPPGQPWQTLLRTHGLRLTPQRELILEAVERLGHGTPDEVHAAVTEQAPSINLSTVYRTLTLLDELGLVRHVFLTDRTPVYHSKQTPHHVHLTCARCGTVADASPRDFDALAHQLREDHGFAIDLERLVVPGVCAGCAEA